MAKKEIGLNYNEEREDLIAQLLGYQSIVKTVSGNKMISVNNPLSKQEYILNKMQEGLNNLVKNHVKKVELEQLSKSIDSRDEFKNEL